jgi:UDP-2,3-diacylglucosamine pyrophosphatase LpxH
MDRAIDYIGQEAEAGDQILGLGDWFHMNEMGLDYCISHATTQKLRDLAGRVPTNLIPGNHDHELERYRDNPSLGNPISPITIIKPFVENNIWYCHGHEYDPIAIPLTWWGTLCSWLKRKNRKTPGKLRDEGITNLFLREVQVVNTEALVDARDKQYKGVVYGHTHLPLFQESPEVPFLLNDGDMRHSSTFVIADDNEFRFMQWNSTQKLWRVMQIPRPHNVY